MRQLPKRKGADFKVKWTPPSALQKIDLILCDEGSQYEDTEWERLFTIIREQPHKPFTVVVADFQQLQPVGVGGSCRRFCEAMDTTELKTVYRSTDENHLVFLNGIRDGQPTRAGLEEYFDELHWKRRDLKECVADGMRQGEAAGEPFIWLTCTNRGSSELCVKLLWNSKA